jgi:glycosyltransferase involved in cell wall biosynthesis
MKISLVAQLPSAHDKIWLREMSRALREAGHTVTVETGTSGSNDTAESWQHSDDERLAAVPDMVGWLRAKWRRNRPDVVHALRWTSGLAALSATRGLAIPVIQSFGSLALSEGKANSQPERRRMEAALGRSVAAVLAASADEAADLVRMGVSRRAITIVPTGVDAAHFAPEAAETTAARGKQCRIVVMGSSAEFMGAECIGAEFPGGEFPGGEQLGAAHMANALRALPRLPGVELVIVGGPDKDTLGGNDDYLTLTKLAKTLGVDDRVTFSGRVGYDELPALLRSADLMLSTAPREPDGMLVLAAMSCGLPVVACATSGALADIIIDETTGLLLADSRPARLADRLRKLLGHPMLLPGMSVAATDRAQSRFSWDRIAAETLVAYGLGGHTPQVASAA